MLIFITNLSELKEANLKTSSGCLKNPIAYHELPKQSVLAS